MLILFGLILLFWLVLMGALTAWSLWLQGYLYTEPSTGIVWRGPAAGSAMLVCIMLWVVMDYQAPGRYRPLWDFSSVEEKKPYEELYIGKDLYKLRPGSRNEYRLNGLPTGKPMPSRPLEFSVKEDDKVYTFKAELDAKGNFKERKVSSMIGETTEPIRYIDEKGRIMYEGSIGQLTTFRGGWFFGNLFLNLLFFIACFLSFWLLLRFQWPHALGQAVVLWFVVLMFVLPPILSRAEAVSQARAVAPK